METIREHDIVLHDGPLRLRSMTEGDRDVSLRWKSDPEVLFFSEGSGVERQTLEEARGIDRGLSWKAWMFISKLEGRPIGRRWLQHMNMDHIGREHPDAPLFRIGLMIGEVECDLVLTREAWARRRSGGQGG